jgi:hypothetical protein
MVTFKSKNVGDRYFFRTGKTIPTVPTKPLPCIPYTLHNRLDFFYGQLPGMLPYLKVFTQFIGFHHPRDSAGDIGV